MHIVIKNRALQNDIITIIYPIDNISHIPNNTSSIDKIHISGLINTKGKINVFAWNTYNIKLQKLIVALSLENKAQFIIDNILYTGKINIDEGKIQNLNILN
jgi:hypothetical protein